MAWDRQYKRTINVDDDEEEEVVSVEAEWVNQVRNLKQMNKEISMRGKGRRCGDTARSQNHGKLMLPR